MLPALALLAGLLAVPHGAQLVELALPRYQRRQFLSFADPA
jgi:hypothetical protein